MANVRINAQKTAEKIKPLHGTVNGPVANHDNSCGTVEAFREIGVPVVFPSKTPDNISMRSASFLAVDIFPPLGRRRSM